MALHVQPMLIQFPFTDINHTRTSMISFIHYCQIFVVNEICTSQNGAMRAMLNLQSRGITEEQILHINNLLEKMAMKFPLVGNA